MSSKAKKHIHKYYRAKTTITSKGYLWACALPACSHHMPEHYEGLLVGKATYCWGCSEQTILDTRTMAMEKPLCIDCDPNFVSIEDPDIVEKIKAAGLLENN